MTPADTRTRLLDAAEKHFAAKGFDGASLREITADADANLAAANYHFGSKEDLFVAVVARRIEPLNRERIALLELADPKGANRAPRVEAVIEAMIGPMLRVARREGANGACFMRLMGRMHSEGELLWERLFEGPLREPRDRFAAALRRALPECNATEIAWRMHFVLATTTNVMADQHRLAGLSHGRCDANDVEGTLRRLVPFLAAGVRAPSRAAKKRKRSEGSA